MNKALKITGIIGWTMILLSHKLNLFILIKTDEKNCGIFY